MFAPTWPLLQRLIIEILRLPIYVYRSNNTKDIINLYFTSMLT